MMLYPNIIRACITLALLLPFAGKCQDTPTLSLDSTFLDFWVGEWNATWEGGSGTNRIEKILDGKVISENFEIIEGVNAGFLGKSYSVLEQGSGTWKQTWVDNSGGYLDFIGKEEAGKPIFWREFVDPKGNKVQQRMVFYNISEKKFDWDWEVSRDGGETWTLRWRIHYEKMK